jgi:hypothetical protein
VGVPIVAVEVETAAAEVEIGVEEIAVVESVVVVV